MDTEPDPEEAARRLRAAFAYVDIDQDGAARLLGVSVPTLARMIGKKGKDGLRPATWGELWRAADALGLPRAWFTADVARYQEIVPDDLPSFPNDTGRRDGEVRPTRDERAAAARRQSQELAREAQRSSERQKAARSTKRARRSRRSEEA